jgi:serine/threonine protein kinase
VNFLHEKKGIAHLDIKPENVVIDSHYRVKLIDLGCCESKQTLMCVAKGTEAYFAPEVADIFYGRHVWHPEYLHKKATYVAEKADIFSMGILLFQLMFGEPPFVQNTPHSSPLLPYLCNTSAD